MVSLPETKDTTITFGHDRKTHKLLKCDKTFNVGLLLKRKNSLPVNSDNKQHVTKLQQRHQTVPVRLTLPTAKKQLDTNTLAL